MPNSLLAFLSGIWKQSKDFNELPAESKKEKFEAHQLTDKELADLIKNRIPQQTTASLSPVIGSLDFLPFGFLDKGRTAGQAVCCLLRRFNDLDLDEIIELAKKDKRIRGEVIKWFVDEGSLINPAVESDRAEFKEQAKKKDVPCATGFLVGNGGYLLTNRHVVKEASQLREFSAAFGYETNLDQTERYSFDPNFWKPAQNEGLDYVLLKLQPPNDEQPRKTLQPISLATVDSVTIAPKCSIQDIESFHSAGKLSDALWQQLREKGFSGDLVNIIQHPEGRSKEIVIFNNELDKLYPDFLVYESDAQPGSSGSPLFNAQWELIGLHRAALLDLTQPTGKQVTGYLGTRISSILADLRTQATSNSDVEIQAFLDAINPKPVPKPTAQQVFILAGRDRSKILGAAWATLEQAAMIKLRSQVKAALNRLDSSITVTEIEGIDETSQEVLKKAIQEINKAAKAAVTTQNVAIELLADGYLKNSNVRGISVYYNGSDEQGKDYATALLGGIKAEAPSLPIFAKDGAFSDLVTESGRLGFCRRTNIPALVFYAGYLSNPEDLATIEALQEAETSLLSEGIAAGLLAWLHLPNLGNSESLQYY
ncbi:MAG: trypsin-like peptidase domain-containing protein [Phormidesmis sp. CAN_BIN36]|nr:trypsin-like peptidase domain-containing protein [Phormidesmis sp. CAN_BIN36]